MIEFKSPEKVEIQPNQLSVFLAGSIEMGTAIDWQAKFKDAVKDLDIVIKNPRRDNWDPTWLQSIDNPRFFEQVDWELNNIQSADFVVFYFDPNTKSPITLLELGIVQNDPKGVIVCCPEGFWRKGNVDIVCQRAGIKVVGTLDQLIKEFIENHNREASNLAAIKYINWE